MNTNKEFLKELKEKRTSYADMIDFCCDSIILNNSIIKELEKLGVYFDIYCGDTCEYWKDDASELQDEPKEFYQYYLISEQDAKRLSEYTNEVVFYNYDVDLYLLAVDHFGTAWSGISANWKELDEIDEEE